MKRIYLMFVMVLAAFGCEQNLEMENPNNPTVDDFWETQQDAYKASSAMYNALIQDGTYMRMYPALNDGRSDGMKADTPWPDLWQTSAFTVPATSGPVLWVWERHYQIVFRANQVLNYVPDIEMENQALKDRILGQAYFLRGLAYFNLANFFKVVPVITEIPTKQETYNVETAPEDTVWNRIITDFSTAADMLPVSYEDVSGPDQGEIGRATKGAATGMLGKAYLYNEEWQNAADEFDKFFNGDLAGVYSLMENYEDNFGTDNENNAESLFEVQFATPELVGGSVMNYAGEPSANWKQVSSQAATYAPDNYGYSDFLPTQWLYEEYKEESTVNGNVDPRLFTTIISYEPASGDTMVYQDPWPYAETTRIYPRKYTNEGRGEPNDQAENSGINYRVLRFSDVMLMYAEALNRLGQQPQAAQYIQRVRDRVNLPDRESEFADYSETELQEQIAHERALEFAFEGQRINDLIRWDWFQDPDKLAELRSRDSEFNTWQEGDQYLPIPQSELDVNVNLKPNPANN